MTTSDHFRAAGEALFGPEWRRELGRQLGVTERQIRRWANGEYDPPPGVWREIAELCLIRSLALSRICGDLHMVAYDMETQPPSRSL